MIAIVDYGMGNLRSVQKALQRVGADAQIVQRPPDVLRAEKVVLPGVGAFADAIGKLRQLRLDDPIIQVVKRGTPFLGICLGLHLLFDVSHEDGVHPGLGLFAGKVSRFSFEPGVTSQNLSVPHMGWNTIQWKRPCPLLRDIDQGAYVYFAHSYHVTPLDRNVTATTTDYGYAFTSSIWSGNCFGVQFHPEKSQTVGLKMLENFVRL